MQVDDFVAPEFGSIVAIRAAMTMKQRARIKELEQQIRDVVGFDPMFGNAPHFPPRLQEAFLKRVLWFETLSREPLCDRLAGAGVKLLEPRQLDDESLRRNLWNVIHTLVHIDIVPINTDHLSDRDVYLHLWNLVNSGQPGVVPHFFSRGWYIDFAASDGNGVEVFLRYYADEEERMSYRSQFPTAPVPEHCDLPYDRDRLIPDLDPTPLTPEALQSFM